MKLKHNDETCKFLSRNFKKHPLHKCPICCIEYHASFRSLNDLFKDIYGGLDIFKPNFNSILSTVTLYGSWTGTYNIPETKKEEEK